MKKLILIFTLLVLGFYNQTHCQSTCSHVDNSEDTIGDDLTTINPSISCLGQPKRYDSIIGTINYYDRFFPRPEDPNKVIKLKFIFLERPGDRQSGIGGFHPDNEEHNQFWDDIIQRLNPHTSNLKKDQIGNTCQISNINDPKVRYEVEKIYIENLEYWAYNGDFCPGISQPNNWWLSNLHDSLNW